MYEPKLAEGFNISPVRDMIFVCDYGQPDMTSGGIFYGDSTENYGRYQASIWRHGEVVAIGPGALDPKKQDGSRLPMPAISGGGFNSLEQE